MKVISIVIFLVIIIGIIVFFRYFFSTDTSLKEVRAGTELKEIEASTSSTYSSNYTYTIWFNIDDWQYRLGEEKVLFERTLNTNSNPKVSFSPNINDINILIQTSEESTNSCVIRNIPLQKWVNLTISLNGRTVDVYLDGKLVRTCILDNIPYISSTTATKITPGGGFNGWTSNFKYLTNATNPQEAYNIYKSGPTGVDNLGIFSIFGNLLSNHQLKFTYLVDNKEKGSLTL